MILILFLFIEPRIVTGFSSLTHTDTLPLGSIYISGETILSRKEIERLLPESGIPFSKGILEGAIKKLLKFYADRGFPFVKVIPRNFQVDSGKVICEFFIDPGYLERIRNVIIEGNNFVSDEFLLRHFPVANGDIFSEAKLNISIKELEKLDYIEVDSFQLIKSQEEGWVEILLYISEGERGHFMGAISYSKNDGWSGRFLGLNENLFGGGRSIEFNFSKEGNIYQEERLKYTEPYIFSLPLDLTIDIQHTYIENLRNLSSILTGIKYHIQSISLSILPGMENYAQSGEGSVSYSFLETGFFYEANNFKLFYRQRWKKGRGWNMEISSMVTLWKFDITGEYFTISSSSSEETELLFFRHCRGYSGITASRGMRIGVELKEQLGKLTLYPLFDTSWIEDNWLYSYGLGVKVNKISIEFAVPKNESPLKGRVYIIFDI